MKAALEIEAVSVYYGKRRALEGVSVRVGEGEIVTLLGANGAGKSTALRAVSGLVRPTGGRIVYAGRDITRWPADAIVAAGIGHVPAGRLESAFELFPLLRERRRQPAGTLSGGEQQMLAMGRALVARPRLLLLDEPSL